MEFLVAKKMVEAKYYQKLENNKVRCLLCPKECSINPDKKGFCNGRINLNGKLYSQNYGKYASIAMDPIEKKPFYHFYPGTMVLSLCPNGCNFACQFCQNWTISQKEMPIKKITPDQTIKLAETNHSFGICYTYTEPLIWYDYLLDTTKLAHQHHLKNILVTNGYINPLPLEELLPYIDAMNVDLKAMKNDFYKNICRGSLYPVLDTIKIANKKCHIEITNLVIPTLNDDEEDFEKLTDFIFEINPYIPLHFSRYFPHYKLDLPSTPISTLKKAKNIAMKKLPFVYLGNIPDEEDNNTLCPKCRQKVIMRIGYNITDETKNGKCSKCQTSIYYLKE